MRSALAFFIWGVLLIGGCNPKNDLQTSEVRTVSVSYSENETNTTTVSDSEEAEDHPHAPAWLVMPFILLLLLIATGPLFYEHFWHKNYPIISVILALIVVVYYLFVLHNLHDPIHHLFEYVQFIALLGSLFIASGGIMINVDQEARPGANVLLLLIGATIANVIGTTGASMLLIRPYIRLNRYRIKPYHIVFFIFLVSNIGGALTPIGDPPIFLGFLKGVPFFWTLTHNFAAWAVATAIFLLMFYYFDKKNRAYFNLDDDPPKYSGNVTIKGTRNFFWLFIIVCSVFLDPTVFDWVPSVEIEGNTLSFVREIIMISVAILSYKLANKEALKINEFTFEPIREVAFIFIGIFGTMLPALELVGQFAASPEGIKLITHNTLYWGTGILSGFLDNAPTYINFLTAAMASVGGSINSHANVVDYANGGVYFDSILNLKAISIAAVFFGAMTYIGNGPNFMVKSIAEEVGIKMPSFFGYIIRFSIPFLLPVLLLTWLLFFVVLG